MTNSIKKISFKALKISAITIGSIIALLFIAPFLFPESISNNIKDLAKKRLRGDLEFSKARFSFFSHFPALTLNLNDFLLKGSEPFKKDTLIAAEQVSLGVDLSSLFGSTVKVNQIFIKKGFINIEVNAKGEANYNVYIAPPKDKNSTEDTTGSTALKIEHIVVENSRLVYDDLSLPMHIDAGGFDYSGNGDFSKSIFDLTSNLKVSAIDFNYDKQNYFVSKTVSAKLVTKINTNSLEFLFEKNDLFINQLQLDFKGRFAFLKNGYDLDFHINSNEASLHNFITAFPPPLLKWLDQTEIKGSVNFKAGLSGQYIAETKTMPSFSMNLAIRNGYIANAKTPEPLKNLFLNFETKMPGFNMDSLYVNVDSIYGNVGKDYLSAICLLRGMNKPEIHAKLNADMDLEKWQTAVGLPGLQFKGHFSAHGKADGVFARGQNPKNFRADTIITSIPIFQLNASFKDGYFKYATLPKALEKVSFDLMANCPSTDYKKSTVSISNINAVLANNYLKGFMNFSAADDFPMEANLKGLLNLEDIKSFYPIDSLTLKGKIDMDILTKGKYNAAKKLFPTTNAHLVLKDGLIQTKYYPHPIEKINVDANIKSTGASANDVSVVIKPIELQFENQPFSVSASLKNFNDLQYKVAAKGTIDIGKIYQVFSRKGLDVQGLIKADIDLAGLQSDATSGKYERLRNSGTLEVKNITARTEYYPHPFFIKNGVLRFKDDKIWLESFNANYEASDFKLDGYLNNLINYTLKNEPLQGQINLVSKQLVADDFMAFANNESSGSSTTTTNSGVFLVPTNLDIIFKATVASVKYNGMNLKDAKGQMEIKQGLLSLKETGFTLIDAPVVMDATYKALSPKRAEFSSHLVAKEFSISKAYKEIKLFHDMATAAANAEGIVSLDYQLKGKLNDQMMPVYPSLEGAGVLSVKAVKMKGFKMFSAAGKEANRDSLTGNADLSKVDIKTTIKNNIITLEQTKIRVSAFRLRLSGQVNFNGQMNLKFRLGLPPLGLIGIPMTVTGTQANPIIKRGKGNDSTNLKEEEDKDAID
jgi:AsmA protein